MDARSKNQKSKEKVSMGTPSEVSAGIILDYLGFKDVKFVNKGYDFIATINKEPCVIEAKIMRLHQIKDLLKVKSEEKRVFLIGVAEGGYCLFELLSGVPRQKKVSKPQRPFKIISHFRYVAKTDFWHKLLRGETVVIRYPFDQLELKRVYDD